MGCAPAERGGRQAASPPQRSWEDKVPSGHEEEGGRPRGHCQRPPKGAREGCDRGLRHAGPTQDRQGLEKQPSDRTTPAGLQPLTGHRPSSLSARGWPALSSSPIQQKHGSGAARPPHRGLSRTLCPAATSHRAKHSTRLKPALRCGKAPGRTTPHTVEQAGCPTTREDQGRTQAPCSPGEHGPWQPWVGRMWPARQLVQLSRGCLQLSATG